MTPARALAVLPPDPAGPAMEEGKPAYLTVRATARRLGVSANLLYAEVAADRFPPARRIGHRIVVPVAALKRWEAGDQ